MLSCRSIRRETRLCPRRRPPSAALGPPLGPSTVSAAARALHIPSRRPGPPAISSSTAAGTTLSRARRRGPRAIFGGSVVAAAQQEGAVRPRLPDPHLVLRRRRRAADPVRRHCGSVPWRRGRTRRPCLSIGMSPASRWNGRAIAYPSIRPKKRAAAACNLCLAKRKRGPLKRSTGAKSNGCSTRTRAKGRKIRDEQGARSRESRKTWNGVSSVGLGPSSRVREGACV